MQTHTTTVQPKPWKRGGELHQATITDDLNAEIVKGKTIRLFGTYRSCFSRGDEKTFDRTFKIGDLAEYDSYNFSYHGTIVAIGEKTVSIRAYDNDKHVKRLDLYTFTWRNWDLDLEKAAKRRSDWSD